MHDTPHGSSPQQGSTSLPAMRAAVALIFFMNGALVATWVSRIPAIQARHGLSHGELGLVLLQAALGSLIAMPLAGWCASRFGSRITCQVTACLFCATIPLLALAPTPLLLGAALFCFGATCGALDVAMNTQASAIETLYRRPIMSSFHAFFSAGGIAGAAAGATFAAAGVLPATHLGLVTLALSLITLLFALPRLLVRDGSAAQQEGTSSSRREFVRPPAALLALGAIAFCVMMSEGAMADWSALFLKKVSHSSESVAAFGYGAFSLTMMFGRFCGDSLVGRYGSIALVRTGCLVSALGVALAVAYPAIGCVLAGFAAVGAGLATIVPLIFSAAARTPGMDAGPALSITTTIGYAGFLVGPPLIGFIADHIGLRLSLGILTLIGLLALILAPSLRSSREPLPSDG